MDKICDFLKKYYEDNGITEKKSVITFKSNCDINMTHRQVCDYIQKKLKIYIKTCLTDINIKQTDERISVEFIYKGNICEIYLIRATQKIYYWVLSYY